MFYRSEMISVFCNFVYTICVWPEIPVMEGMGPLETNYLTCRYLDLVIVLRIPHIQPVVLFVHRFWFGRLF